MMRSLTVRQPYAWAIAAGFKPVENRSRPHSWRGELAIHAGANWSSPGEADPLIQQAWNRFAADLPPGSCHHGPLRRDTLWMAYGAVIAVADLASICTVKGETGDCECGEWAQPFHAHWRLDNVRQLPEPVPAKGSLGVWTLPDEVETAVRAQLVTAVAK